MKLLIILCVLHASVIGYPIDEEREESTTLEIPVISFEVTSTPTPTIIEKLNSNEDVYISKQFYVHSAPEEPEIPITPRPSFRIYFITLPPSHLRDINNLTEPSEDTVVFVINKSKKIEEEKEEDDEKIITSTESSNDDWKNEISRDDSKQPEYHDENDLPIPTQEADIK